MPQPRVNLSAGRTITSCGLDDLRQVVSERGKEGYDFICTYICHPRCCVDINELANKARELSDRSDELIPKHIINQLLPQMQLPDIALTSSEWSHLVVGRISPWIDPDSADPYIRLLSEKALKEELSYFAYLCLPAVLVPLRGANKSNLARIIFQHLTAHPNAAYSVWVDVPITAPQAAAVPNGFVDGTALSTNTEEPSDDSQIPPADCAGESTTTTANADDDSSNNQSTWNWFYEFRRTCDNNRRVHVALELTPDLPESAIEIARWKGEPLAAIKLHTRTFLTNKSTCPVLSKPHQILVKELFMLNSQCLVEGPTLHERQQRPGEGESESGSKEGAARAQGCLYYAYLNALWKNKPPSRRLAEWAPGYDDHLQAPLQPLSDHLEAEVYETFEADPVKYQVYRRAVELAVESKLQNWTPDNTLVIMVLGAGRGPLVTVSYETLKRANVKFKLYAVEKNPCAIVTLNCKCATEWNNEVEVVFSDMRKFQPEEKADIVISELLGSFGDNELSPECLDGALHLMKDDAISIPTSYRSFVAPLHSPKLYNEVRSCSEREHNPMVGFESPYVVRIFNHFEIATPKQLFRFDHPNFQRCTNDRYKEVEFIANESSEMMGVVGYFYATLINKVSLSTVPHYETTGLHSWFPIVFSLHSPIYVKKGEKIRVRFWRCSDERQVWYEWQLMEPVLTSVLNSRGRSYAMRLF